MEFSTINKSTDYFVANLHTGTGSSQAITTGLNMSANGGMIWNKTRNSVNNHVLWDTIRGVQETIYTDLDAAEATEATSLTAFTTTGWTGGGSGNTNGSTITNVSWNWLANGAGSSNTDGSITSSVSANTTAGFSIVSYTGTGSLATVGHGLGSAPKMVIAKNIGATSNWDVYHSGLSGANKRVQLNSNGDESTSGGSWGSTAPTSSVFTVQDDTATNVSDNTYIAYCFSEISGYSKFSSYTGNGVVDGTFIYTGFKPAFVIHKRTDTDASWMMYDNKRQTINPKDQTLFADLNNAESGGDAVDFLSNGFKQRSTGASQNASNGTYIYMAFGQPIISNSGVCATAK